MFKIVIPLLFTLPLLADGPVLKTGQTTVYKINDDGTYQAGIARSYTRSAAGVVTDNATGLEWQDDVVSSTMEWTEAATYCTNLPLDGGGWRLPSKKELHALVDRSRSLPAIDPTFQNTVFHNYWSSTTYAPHSTAAWVVNFYGGYDSALVKTYDYYVRCVRGGQS